MADYIVAAMVIVATAIMLIYMFSVNRRLTRARQLLSAANTAIEEYNVTGDREKLWLSVELSAAAQAELRRASGERNAGAE